MKLAYTIAPEQGATNRLLADLAEALAARGVALAGAVQIDRPGADDGHCDMDLRLLPAGPIMRISQDLGPESSGCRLDPSALEQAVALAQTRLAGAALLIVNKFGKHEAEGRGFRELIAEALARDIPVLLGATTAHLPAFLAFAEGLAEPLPARADALLDWALGAPLSGAA